MSRLFSSLLKFSAFGSRADKLVVRIFPAYESAMHGAGVSQRTLFITRTVADFVPSDHPLRDEAARLRLGPR